VSAFALLSLFALTEAIFKTSVLPEIAPDKPNGELLLTFRIAPNDAVTVSAVRLKLSKDVLAAEDILELLLPKKFVLLAAFLLLLLKVPVFHQLMLLLTLKFVLIIKIPPDLY